MKITVFSKPNCGGCDFTKNWLDENKLEYTAIDVTEDEQALADLKLHGFMSVPVVTVDGWDNAWSDFRPDRLEELL